MNRYYGLPAELRAQAERVRLANVNGTGDADATTILAQLSVKHQEVLDQIKTLDPGIAPDLKVDANTVKTLEVRQRELLAASKGYREELNRISPEYQSVTAKIVSIDNATRSGRDLFTKSQ
jgi:DNA repair ATPase RecN